VLRPFYTKLRQFLHFVTFETDIEPGIFSQKQAAGKWQLSTPELSSNIGYWQMLLQT